MEIVEVSRKGVLAAMREHDRLGEEAFLEKYGFGCARTFFVLHDGGAYSSKAVLGVGRKFTDRGLEPLTPYYFNGGAQTVRRLNQLGFFEFSEDRVRADAYKSAYGETYIEGEQQRAERRFFLRNPKLVRDAKHHHGLSCQGCGFNFEAAYGKRGAGYIECHHIEPLAEQGGKSRTVTVEDVIVVSANCHRMIHRRQPALSMEELKKTIKAAKRP